MKTQNKKLLVLTLILSAFLNISSASAQSFGGFSFGDAKKLLTNAAEAALAEANRLRAEFEKKRAEDAKRAEEQRKIQIAEQLRKEEEDRIREEEFRRREAELEVQRNAQTNSQVVVHDDSEANNENLNTEVKPSQQPIVEKVVKINIDRDFNRTHVTQNSLVQISKSIDSDVKWVMLVIDKDNESEKVVYTAKNGVFSTNLYLKFGAGIYNVNMYTNKLAQRAGAGISYNYLAKFSVENTDARDLSFLLPSGEVESDNEQIISLVKKLTKDAQSDEEALEKIHAYIIKTVKYDWDSFRDGSYVNNPVNALAVLNRPLTVCAGYSNLFAAMARVYGIRTKVIYGKAKIPEGWYDHAWNEVYINDQWQIVDSTWNVDRKDNKYYFIDEKLFAEDHIKEQVMNL